MDIGKLLAVNTEILKIEQEIPKLSNTYQLHELLQEEVKANDLLKSANALTYLANLDEDMLWDNFKTYFQSKPLQNI